MTAFMRAAGSLNAVPGLLIAAMACDNPFGQRGAWSTTLGKIFREVKVGTRATSGEYAFVDTHDLGHLVSCDELLVQQIYDLSLVPFAPDIVIDCGSHIGLFSLIAALRYPSATITAYEPEPENVKFLKKQLDRFGQRVKIVEAALGDADGEENFVVFQSNCGHLDGANDHVPVPNERWLTVRTIDLAAHAKLWEGKNLLMKIDIEGAETRVLPRLVNTLPHNTALFLEVHVDAPARERLRQLLAGACFSVSVTRNSAESSDWVALRPVAFPASAVSSVH
jgi:FkbM family methyltransferase